MNQATRASWKTLPPPERREPLMMSGTFSGASGDRMRCGHVPVDMDDRWFIYFEDGWLHFHRSWTGAHIFAVSLEGSPAGVRVVDGWASRDTEHYRSSDIEHDRRTIIGLVLRYFGA